MTGFRGAICVFAKVPRAGHVKTRLARSLGDANATALAEAFLEDTLAPLQGLAASVVLAFDDDAPERWRGARVRAWRQGEGTLGERIERVLQRALEEHPWAIALGADSPGLPPHFLTHAIDALTAERGPSAVLGPCRDGGFYLLGVRALPKSVLAEVRWSTPHTLEDTEGALVRAGFQTERLATWFDVDEEEDLARLAGLLKDGVIHAPATARVLQGL